MTTQLVTFATNPLILATNAAVATITGGTLATAGLSVSRTNPAGAITGVIMQPGTVDGQVILVENDAAAANSVTFAAAGTSNVANGVTTVVPGLVASLFVWNATTSLWYSVV